MGLTARSLTGARGFLEEIHLRSRHPASSWLTRFLILRLLGLVYFVGFLSAALQVLPLIGSNGLLPVGAYLERLESHFGSWGEGFVQVPTIFWFDSTDTALIGALYIGAVLSAAVVLGFANGIILTVLWVLYMSLTNIGQDWYSFGWEIQLLETGFLAIFLVPLVDGRPFPRTPPPTPVIWLFRFLAFRIMLGAGLIKIRGDACWRDLTCLDYHYETQPVPNPLSRLLHHMPGWFQKIGVLFNHLNELILPWFVFWPKVARHVAGAVMLSFQLVLILSGNLSFLNWLTMVPILACFDDSLLRRILPSRLVSAAEEASADSKTSRPQQLAAYAVTILVGVLSLGPLSNLWSERQVMNTSFDRLHLVNTYGAFGSVGQERYEIIFEGTADSELVPETDWKAYEFKCKPGDPSRRPCVITPYHYRLDWLIWFAAMSSPDNYPWSVHLIWKLLHNDSGALSLLANNPFPDRPPRFIRARLFRYTFSPLGSDSWWERSELGTWLPPVSVENSDLQRFLRSYGWLTDRLP